jgi:hypothetical protein
MGSKERPTITSLALVAGDPVHGGEGRALDTPNFEVVGGLGLGAGNLDTHEAGTRCVGKSHA